jgi:hypothetical protein
MGWWEEIAVLQSNRLGGRDDREYNEQGKER